VLSKGIQLVSTFEQLGGRIHNLRRLADKDDKTWSTFNPSIGISDNGLMSVIFRSSNYVILEHGELHVTTGGVIKNRVWFAELTDKFELQNMRQIDFSKCGRSFPRGIEDPKLLWRDGKWIFTGVAMEKDIPRARNCVCYLDKKAEHVTKVEILSGYETRRPEKNWMTAYKKPKKFDYVYDGMGIVRGNEVIHRLVDNEKLSALRGNAHLWEEADGTYIGLMHVLSVTKRQRYIATRFMNVDDVQKEYQHVFVRVNEDGEVIEKSDQFCFVGKGIEFAAGIIGKDDEFIVSFGKDDVSSHLAIIEKSKVYKMMKSVL
jgi:hypothetical protein